MEYIAFDAHKHYTWARVESEEGRKRCEGRIDQERGALRAFLSTCELGSPVAVETIGTGTGSSRRSKRQAWSPNWSMRARRS